MNIQKETINLLIIVENIVAYKSQHNIFKKNIVSKS